MGKMENMIADKDNTFSLPEMYDRIRMANESIKTTDIKGKDYAEVNQRIKAFRMVYPTGFIHTHMLSNENGVCVFMAQVGYLDGETSATLGTGHAYEKEGSTFINKTSYIENCETSAVGRALAMAGFGIDTSVASAEEVETAIANQDANKTITKKEVAVLERMLTDAQKDWALKAYKIESLADMTKEQHGDLMKRLAKQKEAQNE